MNIKRIIPIIAYTILLITLIICSIFIEVIFFSDLEYSTHSSLQNYNSYDIKGDFIKFTIYYILYAFVVFTISKQKQSKIFGIISSSILIFIHSIYSYFPMIETSDVPSDNIFMSRMIFVKYAINLGIIGLSFFNIINQLSIRPPKKVAEAMYHEEFKDSKE